MSLSKTKSQTADNKLTELLIAPTESALYWTLLMFCSNSNILALHCFITIKINAFSNF